MAAELIFSFNNNIGVMKDFGICSAASLNWAKYTLKYGRGLKVRSELGLSDSMIAIQFAANLKDEDYTETADYLERFALAKVYAGTIWSLDDISFITDATPPHVAVYWTSEHTMGYRYSRTEVEYFEPNEGLWRADNWIDIKAEMSRVLAPYPNDPLQRCMVVKLDV